MNKFAVLENFESEDPKDFKVQKQRPNPNKNKAKNNKKGPAPFLKEKEPEVFDTHNKKKGRGHADRERIAAKKGGRIYDRTKPGKIKKGGGGKGNWGKNDGKAQAKRILAKKAPGETPPAKERHSGERVVLEEESTVEGTGSEEKGEETVAEGTAQETEVEQEEQVEENKNISYEEYLKQQQGTRAKRGKHKIDNSNLDANLKKAKLETANSGVQSEKSSKRAKNKRKRKGVDLKDFLAQENVNFSNKGGSSSKRTTQGGGRQRGGKRNQPNVQSKEAFPPL